MNHQQLVENIDVQLLNENIQQLENAVSMGRANGPDELDLPLLLDLLENIQQSQALIAAFVQAQNAINADAVEARRRQLVINAEQEADISELKARNAQNKARILEHDARLLEHDARFSEIDARLAQMAYREEQRVALSIALHDAHQQQLVLNANQMAVDEHQMTILQQLGVFASAVEDRSSAVDLDLARLVSAVELLQAAPLVVQPGPNAWEAAAAAAFVLFSCGVIFCLRSACDAEDPPLYN
jgi:hypothetical protein